MLTALQQISGPTTLYPVYGRRYATAEAMLKDWREGKDFGLTAWGPYTSIRDFESLKRDASSLWLYDPRSRVRVHIP